MRRKTHRTTKAAVLDALSETPLLPEGVPDRLPQPIRKLHTLVEPGRERDVLITSALGVLSGCLPGVEGMYNGRPYSPTSYFIVTAPAASGKGVANYARVLGSGVEDALASRIAGSPGGPKATSTPPERDSEETALEAHEGTPAARVTEAGGDSGSSKGGSFFKYSPEDLDERPSWKKGIGGENEKKGPPPPRLFLSGDISSSALVMFMERNSLYDKRRDGFGIVFETEIDTLVKTQRQDWGGTSDTLRKAHAHERVSLLRLGDKGQGVSRVVQRPRLAVILVGTPYQVIRLIPSQEDGLFSRFIYYGFLSDDPYEWRDPRPKRDRAEIEKVLRAARGEVVDLWEVLDSRLQPLNVGLSSNQWGDFNAAMRKLKQQLVEEFAHDGGAVVNRVGIHVFRVAMILAVWRAFEDGVDLSNEDSLTVGDPEFRAALDLVLAYAQHSAALMRVYTTGDSGYQLAEQEAALLAELDQKFQRSDAVERGSELGIPERTTDRRLQSLVRLGVLRKVKQGVYRKVKVPSGP